MKSTDIISRLQSGDKSAFAELINQYSDRVYNLALKILHNSLDAEDVVQETFTTVFQKINTFQVQSDLFTWIYRIATNYALLKIRKNKKERLVPDELEKYDNQSISKSGISTDFTDKNLLDAELVSELNLALDNIPEKYRIVFVLRDLENLSTTEVASILEITKANVKIRLRRARLFLREELCAYFGRC
ncbi:sigma-70 family RNA polymerase sigma factor [candidate division KSB1 bacterium]|nr:sigma-70 family RNA polymerase sigma factor [candidate division KSB1 bacterium]